MTPIAGDSSRLGKIVITKDSAALEGRPVISMINQVLIRKNKPVPIWALAIAAAKRRLVARVMVWSLSARGRYGGPRLADPSVDACFEGIERQGAIADDLVVEGLNVEAVAERRLGPLT